MVGGRSWKLGVRRRTTALQESRQRLARKLQVRVRVQIMEIMPKAERRGVLLGAAGCCWVLDWVPDP